MTNHRNGANDFNTKIIEEFRANGGRVGGPLAGTTLILIHHIGAKSGIGRVTPLAASLREDSGVPADPPGLTCDESRGLPRWAVPADRLSGRMR